MHSNLKNGKLIRKLKKIYEGAANAGWSFCYHQEIYIRRKEKEKRTGKGYTDIPEMPSSQMMILLPNAINKIPPLDPWHKEAEKGS